VNATTAVEWRLRGEWFDVCSCKLPCPCSFAQEPPHGDCLFTLVWQVHEGHYGDTDLAGLGVTARGEFAGNMWIDDPNATMKLEGGWPGEFGSLIGTPDRIEYAPITFEAADDLAYWRAEIPGKVDVRVEALTGPTSDPNRGVTTANAPGAEIGPGQVATWGVVKRDQVRGFEFPHDYRGGSSKHFAFDWRPHAVDRGAQGSGDVDSGSRCRCNC